VTNGGHPTPKSAAKKKTTKSGKKAAPVPVGKRKLFPAGLAKFKAK
jgi:hypothetical protein